MRYAACTPTAGNGLTTLLLHYPTTINDSTTDINQ